MLLLQLAGGGDEDKDKQQQQQQQLDIPGLVSIPLQEQHSQSPALLPTSLVPYAYRTPLVCRLLLRRYKVFIHPSLSIQSFAQSLTCKIITSSTTHRIAVNLINHLLLPLKHCMHYPIPTPLFPLKNHLHVAYMDLLISDTPWLTPCLASVIGLANPYYPTFGKTWCRGRPGYASCSKSSFTASFLTIGYNNSNGSKILLSLKQQRWPAVPTSPTTKLMLLVILQLLHSLTTRNLLFLLTMSLFIAFILNRSTKP